MLQKHRAVKVPKSLPHRPQLFHKREQITESFSTEHQSNTHQFEEQASQDPSSLLMAIFV